MSDAIFAWLICLSAIALLNLLFFITQQTNTFREFCQLKFYMNKEEKKRIGANLREFLEKESSNQADLARFYIRHFPITFRAAEQKVSDIVNGKRELDYKMIKVLYLHFRTNIGFLVTSKGEPRVKPFD